MNYLLKKLDVALALLLTVLITGGVGVGMLVFAAATPTFNQTINPGTLAVDVVDASYVTVGSPSVTMGAVTTGFSCLTGGSAASGTLGTATQQIYVQNPGAANAGWDVTIAATSGTTATWSDGGTNTYDFNDGAGSGCTDGADTDTAKGQMTVDASGGTVAQGQYSSNTTSVTAGSSASFQETGTPVSSITILTGAAGSDDLGDWKITGISVKNTIPAMQAAASYSLGMTLTVTAKS